MKNWKDTFLSLIDNGAEQAKSFVEMVNSFDWDTKVDYLKEYRDNLIEKGNDLVKSFTDLLKQVKDSLTDFSVTVPFDESIGEKLSYEINGSKLVIEVTYSDETSERSNKTSVVIPSNCDLEKISHTVNAALKTATIIIPKMVIEPLKEEATPTEKPKKKTVRKKPADKAETNTEAEEKAADEPMTHISSKLVQKIQQNTEKARILHRAANGRFVRRTVEQTNEN